jgi:uncharacterized metal-binding protein YceD (DUF177 family)
MIIQFQKATPTPKEFSFETDGVLISGTFEKVNNKLVKISSNIKGDLGVNCSRCSKKFHLSLDEDINFRVSNDIVETYDETINFDEIFGSEIESIKNDFNFCEDCQDDSEEFETQII